MDPMIFFYIFMTALFSALIMVPTLRRWALVSGNVDVPDERKIHSQTTPRIGGVAIFMATLFATLVFTDLNPQLRGILAGALIVFFTGLIDDLHGLSPKRKFIGQICACLITISVGGLYLSNLGNLFGFGDIVLGKWFAIPFTVFAVVGVINAINLIDGLDGLAGGVSVIALTAFFALGYQDENYSSLVLCAGLLGGILGFLKYNFYPARIFMGDTGSLVVGFLVGFLAIQLTQAPGAGVRPIVPVLVIGLPLLDTVWVMTRRVLKGGSPFSPDMTHVHHKFLNLGFQHRFTVIIIYGISLFWAIFALVFHRQSQPVLLASYLVISTAAYMALRYISTNRERFKFLSKDSAKGIRETATYQRIAEIGGHLIPMVIGLQVGYLVIAVWVGGQDGGIYWQVAGVLLVGVLGLLYFTRDIAGHFLLAMIYVAALVIVFTVESNGEQRLWFGVQSLQATNLILVLISCLVMVIILFRKPGGFFLSTVDFLIFGISIFAAVVFSESERLYVYSDILWRGIVLFLAVKVTSCRSPRLAGVMVYSFLAVLLVVGVRSYFV